MTHQAFPPHLNIVPFVSPVSSTNQTSSFLAFCAHLPLSSFPPALLVPPVYSFIPALPSLPRFNFSRHFFPFRQQEKPGGREEGRGGKREKKRKKAHARCCQSRRVFFRLSQTPNARLGFRLTDNRRGEDSSSVVRDASRSSIHHISCAWIDVKRFYPCRLACIYTPCFYPLDLSRNRSWLVAVMHDGVASRVDWSWFRS